MIKEEGILSLWKGYVISMFRAVSMTSAMLTTNDEIKEKIKQLRGAKKADTLTNLSAAAISGVACSFFSMPFDNVKTKLQKMKRLPDGTMPYKGILDCFQKTISREGITGPWAGYSAYYLRVAPHAMILLITDNLLHKAFNPNHKH